MKQARVYHYDAFTDTPGRGNPGGVVLDAHRFSDEEMQHIAAQVGFNETAFILPSDTATLRIRYFTPGHEMNLCGHGTIAALACMSDRGELPEAERFDIETKAGILPIRVSREKGRLSVTMAQAEPQFVPFQGSVERLAYAMGIHTDDIDSKLPIVYGSTGIWTLLIPIRSLEAFEKMSPKNELFPEILTQMPKASLHPFGFETVHPKVLVHARHFSSPYSGTVEDPVTGTASGVMGAYYVSYIRPFLPLASFKVEQGFELGREGYVTVDVKKVGGECNVSVTGTAVLVREMEIAAERV